MSLLILPDGARANGRGPARPPLRLADGSIWRKSPTVGSEVLYTGLGDGVRVDGHARLRGNGDALAIATFGFAWAEIVSLLSDRILKAEPDLMSRCGGKLCWKLYARTNGVRIGAYDEPSFFQSYRQTDAAAGAGRS